MSDFGNKISELNPLSAGNMAGEIPLSLTLSSGTLATNKITLSQLRDLFDFDSAYSSVEEGIAATVENQMFYVYVDNNKLSVNEYIRTNIGANAVIGKSGTKKIIYIPALLKHIQIQVESFAALREFKPWWEGQRVELLGYYKGSDEGGGVFRGSFTSLDDDGGFVAGGIGYHWLRVESTEAVVEMFGAKGDGVTDDRVSLIAAGSSKYSNKLSFTKNKVYLTTGSITAVNAKIVEGNGATIKMTAAPAANTNVFVMGQQKGTLSGFTLQGDQFARTFTLPGIGAFTEVGDLISLGSDSYRLQFDNNYYYGQRAIVTAITGDTVTINAGLYEAFQINTVTVHRGKEPLVLENLNIDLLSIPSTPINVQALSITGVNVSVKGCKVQGSSYCAVGLGLQGCIGRVENCLFGGFLNANGTSARVGYGIYLDGVDLVVTGNNFYNNKHCVTSASRRYLACGIVIENNHADTVTASNAEAVFDFHYNVVGVPVVQNNHIYAGKAVFNARNGGAKFVNNYIYNNRTDTNSSPGVIAMYECPNVYYLEFSNNYIETSSNVRLLYLGDVNEVKNIIVTNNTGRLGSIFNQAMNIVSMKNMTIENNNFAGMTQIFEMNRRSAASTQFMFALIENVSIFNNTFDLTENGTVGVAAFHIWCHANTTVANKLKMKNFSFKNNKVFSKDTPILIEFINGQGNFEITENTFDHAVSSSTVSAPTNNTMDIQQSNFSFISIVGNTAPGRIRFGIVDTQKTGSTAYPAEDVVITFAVNNNKAAGVFFDCMAATIDRRVTFGYSQIKNNLLVNPYGTTIGFTSTFTNMGWNGGGVVDISGNALYPTTGASVGISLGFRVHRIAISYNTMSAAINDTATQYSVTGNVIVPVT